MMEHIKLRVIVTGATGMVGEGVLHECLLHPEVEAVLVVGRKPCGVSHPRLTELICADLSALSPADNGLSGYNACFFCAGISSIGVKEQDYFRITYTLTMNFAQTLSQLNPGMTFCYVSGAGTDSTEKGRMSWARVKGKTENDLMKLPFKAAFAYRPSFMLPTPGLKHALSFYKYIGWLYPVLRPIFPGAFITLRELGLAMIQSVLSGSNKKVLDSKEIAALASK